MIAGIPKLPGFKRRPGFLTGGVADELANAYAAFDFFFVSFLLKTTGKQSKLDAINIITKLSSVIALCDVTIDFVHS